MYRLLEKGDILQKGDEVYNGMGEWVDVGDYVGCPYPVSTVSSHVPVRRKIQDNKEPVNSQQQTQPEISRKEPCGHPGCHLHVSHPCEKCGQQW